MTTIGRRGGLPRYTIARSWCQERQQYMWSVVDRQTRTWARGTNQDGYDNEADAQAVLAKKLGGSS
jgi:hypothetical protein